jgi:hypothetical protein
MCTFSNYSDCKKAVALLKEKHPKCKIWMDSVTAISSFEEWQDKFNSEISDYKK